MYVYCAQIYPSRMTKKETFGERVRRLRKGLGMTQPALAKACHIKQSSLSVIENGETKPANMKAPTLAGLAAALKTTPSFLLTGIEAPARPKEDALFNQLTELYHGLTPKSRDEVLGLANYLYSKEHPEASKANPYGKRKKEEIAV